VKLPDLLRTTAVRLAARYCLAYLLVLLGVMLAFHWASSVYINADIRAGLAERLDELQSRQRSDGAAGLIRALDAAGQSGAFALYQSADGTRLAGNLLAWPDELDLELDGSVQTGWIDAELLPDSSIEDDAWLPVAGLQFTDGSRLLLARHVRQAGLLGELREYMLEILGTSFLLALLLSLLTGRHILGRMNGISRTAADIMAGDLARRVPVSDRNDEFDRLAGQLNAMLDRMQLLIRGMRDVTNNIAHDLRSPLSRLQGRLEVTLLEHRSSDEYRQALQDAIEDARGLQRTFNALLSIAQAEAGNHPELRQDINLNALMLDLAELYGPSAEERDQRIMISGEQCGPVRASRDLLAQAVGNLLENAIKYTPTGGTITLSTRQTATGCELCIADNGPGIPADQREHVLERFVRLDESRHTGGNGLGLSLVRAVAALYGARLELGDAHPGLRVTLTFPAPA
jgi:signal transduction histidine kinase